MGPGADRPETPGPHRRARDVVRVEVIDEGRGFRPSVREPRADAEGGWGLYLVDQLADRWGVRDDGRVVWAELESEIALSA